MDRTTTLALLDRAIDPDPETVAAERADALKSLEHIETELAELLAKADANASGQVRSSARELGDLLTHLQDGLRFFCEETTR